MSLSSSQKKMNTISPNFPTLTDRERQYPAMSAVADGFPSGWTLRRVPRLSAPSIADNMFYSPRLELKFRHKAEVRRFLDCLERTDGNEAAATRLLRHEAHGNTSSASSSSTKLGNKRGKDKGVGGDNTIMCSRAKCTNAVFSGGLCRKHGPRCDVYGCDNAVYARGHCRKHDVLEQEEEGSMSMGEEQQSRGALDSAASSTNSGEVTVAEQHPEKKSPQKDDSVGGHHQTDQRRYQLGNYDQVPTSVKVKQEATTQSSRTPSNNDTQYQLGTIEPTPPRQHQVPRSMPRSHIKFESESEDVDTDDNIRIAGYGNHLRQSYNSQQIIDLTTADTRYEEKEYSRNDKKQRNKTDLSASIELHQSGGNEALSIQTPEPREKERVSSIPIIDNNNVSPSNNKIASGDDNVVQIHEHSAGQRMNEGGVKTKQGKESLQSSHFASPKGHAGRTVHAVGNTSNMNHQHENGDNPKSSNSKEARVLLPLPAEMKTQLKLLIRKGKGSHKGVSEGDILSKIKGFVAACHGVATEEVLTSAFPNELVIKLLYGKKRYFFRVLEQKEHKEDTVLGEIQLDDTKDSENERSEEAQGYGMSDVEHRVEDTIDGVDSSGNSDDKVNETVESDQSVRAQDTGTPTVGDRVQENTSGTVNNEDKVNENVESEHKANRKESSKKKKKPVILSVEMKSRVVSYVSGKGKQGVIAYRMMNEIKDFQRSCQGVSIHDVLRANLSKELRIESFGRKTIYFLAHALTTSNSDQVVANEKHGFLESEVAGAENSVSQQKSWGKEDAKKEKLIELTIVQARETKYPPGCQVMYYYKLENALNKASIQVGVILSANISLSGDFIYAIKVGTSNKSEDDHSVKMMIAENLLAYAPTTSIYFQPDPAQEAQNDGVVLLPSKMGGENSGELKYSVLTPSGNGEHAIHHNVLPGQLSFRDVSSMSEDLYIPKLYPTSAPTNEAKAAVTENINQTGKANEGCTAKDEDETMGSKSAENTSEAQEQNSITSDKKTKFGSLEGLNAKDRRKINCQLSSSGRDESVIDAAEGHASRRMAEKHEREAANSSGKVSVGTKNDKKSKKSKRKRTEKNEREAANSSDKASAGTKKDKKSKKSKRKRTDEE